MEILKKWVAVLFIVLGVLVAAPQAQAADEPEEKANTSKSFSEYVDECAARTLAGPTKDRDDETVQQQAMEELKAEDKGWVDKAGHAIINASCRVGTTLTHPVATAGAAMSKFWGDPVGKFTQALLEGNNEALQAVMTLWMDYRVDKNVVDSNVQGVKNIVLSLSGLALIASLVVGGGRIAAGRRKGLVEGVEDSGETIALYLLFSLLVPGLIAGAVVASDELSDWIMKSFGATSAEQVLGDSGLNEEMAGPVFMLGIAGVAFAGSIMQIIALAVRTLLLPIAAGLTPMMAAMSFTQTGKNGLHHLISLMIASVIFKPVSALLYCVAFWMSAHGGDDLVSTLMIAVMLGAAGFTGPTLVRALVPAVAQAGGGGAAPVLAGGAALAGGVLGKVGGVAGQAGKSVTSAGQAQAAPAAAAGVGAGVGAGGGLGRGGGAGGGLGGGSRGVSPTGPSSGGGGSGAVASGSTGSGAGSTAGGAVGGRAGHSEAGGGVASGAASTGPGSQSSGASGGGSHSIGAGGGAQPAGAVAAGAGAGSAGPGTGGGGANRGRMGASTPRRTMARATGGALRAGGAVARTGAGAARTAGTAANRVQAILDESVGAQGNYGMRR